MGKSKTGGDGGGRDGKWLARNLNQKVCFEGGFGDENAPNGAVKPQKCTFFEKKVGNVLVV